MSQFFLGLDSRKLTYKRNTITCGPCLSQNTGFTTSIYVHLRSSCPSYWPFIMMSTLEMSCTWLHYASPIGKLDTLTCHVQAAIISNPLALTTKWCSTIWPPMNQPYSYFFNPLYLHYYTLFTYSWSLDLEDDLPCRVPGNFRVFPCFFGVPPFMETPFLYRRNGSWIQNELGERVNILLWCKQHQQMMGNPKKGDFCSFEGLKVNFGKVRMLPCRCYGYA